MVLPLLDADVLIDIDRDLPAALAWLSGLPAAPPVAGIAALELLAGCQNNADRLRTERLLRRFPRLWPDASAMEAACAGLAARRLSHNLGVLDALIAETALLYGLPLATFNTKHFDAVPGLVTVQPYSRP